MEMPPQLDGIVDRIEDELGQKVTVIATGGMSRKDHSSLQT